MLDQKQADRGYRRNGSTPGYFLAHRRCANRPSRQNLRAPESSIQWQWGNALGNDPHESKP
jgi:hypothetical protein